MGVCVHSSERKKERDEFVVLIILFLYVINTTTVILGYMYRTRDRNTHKTSTTLVAETKNSRKNALGMFEEHPPDTPSCCPRTHR